MNNVMMPKIAGLVEEMTGLRFRNKRASAFGSHGWSGGAVDRLSTRLQDAGFEMSLSLKAKWRPDIDALEMPPARSRHCPSVGARSAGRHGENPEQQEACACAAAAPISARDAVQRLPVDLRPERRTVAGCRTGTPWSEVPDNFLCPECSLGKDVFDELGTEAK
jgi:anaerobic nitric oxide reductase flavorubredoxin